LVDKIVKLEDAMALIGDEDTVCISGFVGIGTPECLLRGIEERFDATQSPKNLSLLFSAAPGDGKDGGLNRIAKEGLVKRAIGGHWSLVPKLGKMAVENKIAAYNLPLGCISQLYRDIAAGKPGMFSKVGLNTFVDPRQIGGAINDISTEKLVELKEIDGNEWLFYRSIPIDVALIRATTADKFGNITMEREALMLDVLPVAMAAKNSGGVVIVQVERIAAHGSLAPRDVIVPGNLVDCVVVADASEHRQTYSTQYDHAFSGRLRGVVDELPPMAFDQRKIIARRATMELPINGVVNLGIGMPEGVGTIANEEGILDHIMLTTEAGVLGGVPQSGLDFGAAINAESIIQTNHQFDFYDGGGLDMACLGMAEVDQHGNVNVSRFKDRFAGAGGFINISQNARKLVFVGTFTAKGLKISAKDNELIIDNEGAVSKFIEEVEQITFNGPYAASQGKEVLYVTERCVFRLTSEGLELAEVAPGVDIEKDILAHMAFKPIINEPKVMNPAIFDEAHMKLNRTMLSMNWDDRLHYNEEDNTVFANISGVSIDNGEDLDAMREKLDAFFAGIGRKVDLISNYDGVSIAPRLSARFADMLSELETKYYHTATRYTTSAFLRQKMGQDLKTREISPHIFETQEEAAAYVKAHKDA
jgi:propionate CoA-transferase